jgi:SAM-dependent methyltransferase
VVDDDDRVASWLEALEHRHLANLTASEAARALRALSSCYVERRARLARGGALESAGKRAAFALFYAPMHFLVVREIVRALGPALQSEGAGGNAEGTPGLESRSPAGNRAMRILDLGCGTGAAGAAWALENGRCMIDGIDRHPWAVAEANWTYRALGLAGRARQANVDRVAVRGADGEAILAAYTVNELPDATRDPLLPRLLEAHAHGCRILIVEPIARRMAGWWSSWEDAFTAAGGAANEWRFGTPLPERQRQLGRAAGLDPRELTARSLHL